MPGNSSQSQGNGRGLAKKAAGGGAAGGAAVAVAASSNKGAKSAMNDISRNVGVEAGSAASSTVEGAATSIPYGEIVVLAFLVGVVILGAALLFE